MRFAALLWLNEVRRRAPPGLDFKFLGITTTAPSRMCCCVSPSLIKLPPTQPSIRHTGRGGRRPAHRPRLCILLLPLFHHQCRRRHPLSLPFFRRPCPCLHSHHCVGRGVGRGQRQRRRHQADDAHAGADAGGYVHVSITFRAPCLPIYLKPKGKPKMPPSHIHLPTQNNPPNPPKRNTALRGSIFTSAKLGLWHEVLRETTTPTVPPADEYERPEELREVALNRMQVRFSVGVFVCLAAACSVKPMGTLRQKVTNDRLCCPLPPQTNPPNNPQPGTARPDGGGAPGS